MNRKLISGMLAGALVLGCGAAALAAPTPSRVRGTIESIQGHTIAIKGYNGKTMHVTFNNKTKFVSVVRAKLDDIKPGDFIGAGATGPNSKLSALEVVIFPDSMRGMGEGHYGWSVPAAVAAADRDQSASPPPGAPPVQGTMTNGTVRSAKAASSAPPVQGTMTNGTIKSAASVSGGKELAITYNHGEQSRMRVNANTPVVRFVPASHSVMAKGAKTFVLASRTGEGHWTADFVAVGKDGLTPPM